MINLGDPLTDDDRSYLQQAIESKNTPICIRYRGRTIPTLWGSRFDTSGAQSDLMNEAFFLEENGPEIIWTSGKLEVINRDWGYAIFKKYIGDAKEKINIELDNYTTEEALKLIGETIVAEAKVPVNIGCHNLPLEKAMERLEFIVKGTKVHVIFDKLGSWKENGESNKETLLGFDKLPNLIQKAQHPITLKLNKDIDLGGEHFRVLNEAAEESKVPVHVRLSYRELSYIKNEAFLRKEIDESIKENNSNLSIKMVQSWFLSEKDREHVSDIIKEKVSGPVTLNCEHLIINENNLKPFSLIAEKATSRVDVKNLRFAVETEGSIKEIKQKLKDIADKGDMNFQGEISVKNHGIDGKHFEIHRGEALDQSYIISMDSSGEEDSEEEQVEASTGGSGGGDDKPDDSAGGDVVREEKEKSKAVSVFLSSEPELLNLRPEEFTQNETEKEREYRESVEAVEKGLVYEAQKAEFYMAVDIENVTEETLPHTKDVPMTKVSGGLPILQAVCS